MDRTGFHNRSGGPGRGPPLNRPGGREFRRGGPGDYRGAVERRGHPGLFHQNNLPMPVDRRRPMVTNHGPPPPPPRQAIHPPPRMFSHSTPHPYPGNIVDGRRLDPRRVGPLVQRGVVRGPGLQAPSFRQQQAVGDSRGPSVNRNRLHPVAIPPPPPPPQANSHRPLNHNIFSANPLPLNGYIPQHTSPSVPTVTTVNKINIADWSEFTAPEGFKYYYNSVTKESTFDKPAGFVSPLIRSTTQQVGTTKPSKWIEYTDGATGKKYYSNGDLTTWEKPATYAATSALPISTAPPATEKTPASTSTSNQSDQPRKKLKTCAKPKIEFGSKDEAVAAFKGLLIAKDVPPTLKWSELSKLYSSDSRWIMCEDALTTGERKQALAEYQTKRANELRLIERQEKVRARDAFVELLTDSLPKRKSFAAWNTSFKDIRDSLARDDRFHAVAEESTRENLFLDFCEEFRKREERKKRNMRREAQDNFVALLAEKQDSGLLSFASTWNSFVATLSEEDRGDSRFGVSVNMSDSDREVYFADFVLELQASEDDKRRRIRDARRRAEQAQRDAFCDFLCRLARGEGKIFPWSGWRELEGEITIDASYEQVVEQRADLPRQLFEEFVSEWNQRYRRDRELLWKLMRLTSQTKFIFDAETSYETFIKAILGTAENSTDLLEQAMSIVNQAEPVSNATIYFKEMQSRIGPSVSVASRAGSLRRGHYNSSEDEGEIIEDGEVEDERETNKNAESLSGCDDQVNCN